MDEHVVAHLECDDWDVLTVCDYRDLNKTSEVSKTSEVCDRVNRHYEQIVAICWSMGVWAYARISGRLNFHANRVIAINGTPQPIHAEFGIAPDVFQATLDRFDAKGREKFFERMCGSRAIFERFAHQRPQRELSEQAEELAAIQAAAVASSELFAAKPQDSPPGRGRGGSGVEKSITTHPQPLPGGEFVALISTRDRIMPAANQQRYWDGRAHCNMIDAPHYPFFLWNRWTDLAASRADG